ncbi:hypothetical protein BOTCAL_0140g00180 [Botryotinia calthae]|uniref:Uncharacterized protein n=1 Tax=Botryotinia calthae TaxID=38488 RepID=A0A4Y8D314_9HELO|nr:hypothetical protein BOTCAL_0140g00180 [Botryotinia calthae]
MPSNNFPSRNRRMPERLNSPSVQIETSTHSQTVATIPITPPPITPTYASSTSPSSAASTPTPLIRSGGIKWRKNLRATLPVETEAQHLSAQHRQESEASVVEAQANSIPEPRPEVEYNVDSPSFGIKHTPEWDDLGIHIDDQSQGRWYPPGLMASTSYESLSHAAKIMLFHEVTKKMSFKNLVAYLNVTGDQLDDFIELYNSEIMRYIKEEELERFVEVRMSEIRRREDRLVTAEDFDLMLYQEVDSKLPPTVLDSPIPLLEIGKAIAFLQTCYGSQIPENHLNNGLRPNNVVLSLSEFNEIIEEMGKYYWLGESHYYDFDHDLGLVEYIDEINRVNSVKESVPSAQEVEEPAQQPIGRPKKRGKQFGNKPLRNKADLLKMVLSSKVQQMDGVEDKAAKKAEGRAVDKGKGKML